MQPTKRNARIAGLLYLVLIVSGILSLIYIPSQLIVWDDPTQTVKNISESKFLFQIGIICGLIMYTSFILLPLALFKLLSSVDKTHALLMVIFAVISVPISYLNMVHHMDVLTLLEVDYYSKVFETEEFNSKIMMLLDSHSNGELVAHIFWGLWLLPFGWLVYKSGFLPKFFGIMLMLGCFGYLIDFFGYFLMEGYGKTLFANIVGIPSAVGEIGICLWLLIVGIKTPKAIA